MAEVWKKVAIRNKAGVPAQAVAPVIVSASRATDIPAFYAGWLRNRLEAGYCVWVNPFTGVRHYISFAAARVFVFWSKNPAPLLPQLPFLNDQGLNYYFQFTLNDYDAEGLEPGVPPVERRIELFRDLARQLGRQRVVWRFDPLLITRRTPPERLLEKVLRVGAAIHAYAERLVISFADLTAYPRVAQRLRDADLAAREFTADEMRAFAGNLAAQARRWGLEVRTCAEAVDLSACGIGPNKCIDDDLLVKWFPGDAALLRFLGRNPARPGERPSRQLKDRGQRKACGCIVSKDIGHYNTCPHLCCYCYANSGRECVARAARHNPHSESILDE